MSERELLSRRAFLAGATKAGAASALGLTFGGPAYATAEALRRAATDQVRVDPHEPPSFTRYLSRPDLTPVGVSVRSVSGGPLRLGAERLYIFCAPKAAQQPFPKGASPGLTILDSSGELVWFKPLEGLDRVPFNFQVQSYRGKPVLTWFQGRTGDGYGVSGEYVLADNAYRQITRVLGSRYPPDVHEFLLTPQGTALHTAFEESASVRFKGRRVLIGHVQEVEVATGKLLFDWPSYPAVSFAESYVRPGSGHFDYFHVNSIGRWPGPGRKLLICARNTSTIYLVSQATKRVLWRLGGKRSNFRIGPGVRFWYQHDARALADGSGVSLFDDASHPAPERQASGKVVDLNLHTGRARLRHRYLHVDGEVSTANQGNCQLLPGGGHLIGWGAQPFFSVYAPSPGTLGAPLILDGRFPRGAQSYRVYASHWRGDPPHSELALAVRHAGASGALGAHMSWNGTTEVASWRLAAGPSETALETVSTRPRTGFETTIHLPAGADRYFQATALDRHGRVLGRTRVVQAKRV